MVISSPRQDARGMDSTPSDWGDERQHRGMLARAIWRVQERLRISSPPEVTSVSADYTMTDIDGMILVNAAGGNRTITLLTAASRKGREIYVKKTDASDNLVIIDAAGAETLDDATTVSLTQKNALRGYKSDGINWKLISAIGNATAL